MKIQTHLDNFKLYDKIILPTVIAVLLITGTCLQLFGPSTYEEITTCAYTCTDHTNIEFDASKCTGIDPNQGTAFTVEFKPLIPMNRMNKVLMTPFLNRKYVDPNHPSFYSMKLSANVTLEYNEDSKWVEWQKGMYTSQVNCYNNEKGSCTSSWWIKEPYIMHDVERLTVQLNGPYDEFSNICITQAYGSKNYSISRIVYIVFFTVISCGYLVYYFVYLMVRRIYPNNLNIEQYLNIGLMFAALAFNDPIDLLALAVNSPFFPILHGIMNTIFLAYLIFFVIAFFQYLRIDNGLFLNKKVEWIVAAVCTGGMIFSFMFSASLYYKGMTDNPFAVIKPATTLSVVMYTASIIFITIVFIWIIFMFFTSYQSIRKHNSIVKCIYFCATSLIVIGIEFTMLIFSDYTSFFNTSFTSEIFVFGINAYIFAMFYAFVPSFVNQFDEVVLGPSDNDDTKPILHPVTEEPETNVIQPSVDPYADDQKN
ncbi:hypothetical protein EIN_052380 [Entamoeba invadens IP1]|uniref:hypothetical protein n=1 Tax=Entamoeba invadens IP1 TaxID=370355 RepID=UPI0002C3CF37|nr:hypothetical protein EIN_052380 [Entamoeba invadens IP1]ELP93033.1 hypothetical protein EIN_052380 [Entamoeba invadens IP1]|eukprot:XP_004259804.1 hypothetical protein EIN_052380 [Entamoeba invadens IP1]